MSADFPPSTWVLDYGYRVSVREQARRTRKTSTYGTPPGGIPVLGVDFEVGPDGDGKRVCGACGVVGREAA